MATDRAFADFVLDRLSGVAEISTRPMMGEYVLYHRGKVVGGIYDNRLLVKVTPSARAFLPEAAEEVPYPGAKGMLAVDPDADGEVLKTLFAILYDELPVPKKKK